LISALNVCHSATQVRRVHLLADEINDYSFLFNIENGIERYPSLQPKSQRTDSHARFASRAVTQKGR
jgi:hypothetical protein